MKQHLCLFLAFFSFLLFSNAQEDQANQSAIVETTYAEFLGKTPPIRDLIPKTKSDSQKRSLAKRNRKIPKNFVGRGRRNILRPDLEHQGPDPIRQTGFNRDEGLIVEPLVNIDGITSGGAPNDPTGAVGKDHYMQAVNATTIAVYDKQGNLQNTFTGNTLWNEIGFSSAGDPIILYDQEVDRWIITEFPPQNQLLVAISEDSDPMGSYTAYNFSTPNFPDYPKYGIWPNAYSVTTNEGGAGTFHSYFINRAQLLAGEPMVQIQRVSLPGTSGSEQGFVVATPVHWMGQTTSTDPIIIALNDSSWGDVPQDAIKVFSVSIDWDEPNNTTFAENNIPVTPYDANPCGAPGPGFACVPQSGGNGLDGIPEVIMHMPHYRNFGSHESMVMNFVTDVDNGNNLAGIRWIELRRVPGGEWTSYQEGTFAPDDGLHRFMGNIAIDRNGNIALGYNVSSDNDFVGVRFTGRRASDPLGEMTIEEYNAVDGTNSIQSFGRFGDYSHMSVDPENEKTFWFTTEYASSAQGGDVNTRIIAFEFGRDTTDIGPSAVISPQSANDLTDSETITIEVTNFGLDTPSVFQVGYLFESDPVFIQDVNFTLFPDSVYTHSFPQTVDMSEVGDYQLSVFTRMIGDQAPFNDTLNTVISKLSRFDAGITGIDGINNICGDSIPVQIQLANFGTESLTSAIIEINLNGNLFQTINWTGNLIAGASTNIEILLAGILDGTNMISASSSLPNGNDDEIMANDGINRSFNAILDGVPVFLNIRTDNFPAETTWEVADEAGNILYSGGPYDQDNTLFVEEFCLGPDDCFTFTIEDAYNDGICCAYGQGFYNLTDPDGLILGEGDGDFGGSETIGFCATFMCMLEADIEISAESAPNMSDGTLLIIQENGVGPFQYSIDGGNTFQDSNVFNGLAGGDYDIVVQGAADCLYEETITIPVCAIDILVEVANESEPDALDGQIEITVINANSDTQYSIDGGNTFQNSSIFTGLGAGDYEIVVQDGVGCSVGGDATIDIINSTDEFTVGQLFEVFPNPTDGVFRINAKGIAQQSVFLNWEIYNADGKAIQYGKLTRYNDTYTGLLSLVHYPSGIYYVRFLNDDVRRMIKVVRK